MSLNFARRYKWAFRPAFDELPPADPVPDLQNFVAQIPQMFTVRVFACSKRCPRFMTLCHARQDDYSPSASLKLAGDILSNLNGSEVVGYAGKWADERKEVGTLSNICVI